MSMIVFLQIMFMSCMLVHIAKFMCGRTGFRNFTTMYSSVYGNCYSFSTESKARKAGPHYGKQSSYIFLIFLISLQNY